MLAAKCAPHDGTHPAGHLPASGSSVSPWVDQEAAVLLASASSAVQAPCPAQLPAVPIRIGRRGAACNWDASGSGPKLWTSAFHHGFFMGLAFAFSCGPLRINLK